MGIENRVARWLSGGFYASIVGLAAFYVVHNWDTPIDDSFITYRYADNLKNGYGLVFNAQERHYGSTAMGFAVLLAGAASVLEPVARAGQSLTGIRALPYVEIPRLAVYASGTSLALMLIVWSRAFRRTHDALGIRLISLAAVPYVFMTCRSNADAGHKTYVFVALLFLASYLVFFSASFVWGAVVLATATTVRPDSVLFFLLASTALVVGSRFGWEHVRRWRIGSFALIFLALTLGWAAFTWIYFGAAIPRTMLAKQAQVRLGHWPLFRLQVAAEYLWTSFTPGIRLLLAVVVLCSLVAAVRASRRGMDRSALGPVFHAAAWVAFAIGLVLAYRTFRVTWSDRYGAPLYFATVFVGLVAAVLFQKLDGWPGRGIARWSVAAVVLVGGVAIGIDLPVAARSVISWTSERPVRHHIHRYDPIVEYLARIEPEGTVVATGEPGMLGYRLGPKFVVVDELGLVSPEVARHIIEGDLDYPFTRWQPKYVIVSWPGRFNPHERAWFDGAYAKLGEFHHPYWAQPLNRGAYLYVRKADASPLRPGARASRVAVTSSTGPEAGPG